MTEDRTIKDPWIKCITCGHSGYQSEVMNWHNMRHIVRKSLDEPVGNFKPAVKTQATQDTQPGASGAQEPSQGAGWPFDPVLRQALMDVGVITPDDLSRAEAKIRAVSGQFAPVLRTIVEDARRQEEEDDDGTTVVPQQ